MSLETYEFLYKDKMFLFISRFSSSVQLISWEVFYQVLI